MAATLSLQAAAAGAVACSARCRAAAAVQAWRPAGAAGRGQQQRRSVSSNRALLGGRRASAAASDSSAGGLATHGEPSHLQPGRPWRAAVQPPLPAATAHCSLLLCCLPTVARPFAAAGNPATAEGSAPLLVVEGDIVTLNWKCFNEEGEVGAAAACCLRLPPACRRVPPPLLAAWRRRCSRPGSCARLRCGAAHSRCPAAWQHAVPAGHSDEWRPRCTQGGHVLGASA
jgi:hypothetical protein